MRVKLAALLLLLPCVTVRCSNVYISYNGLPLAEASEVTPENEHMYADPTEDFCSLPNTAADTTSSYTAHTAASLSESLLAALPSAAVDPLLRYTLGGLGSYVAEKIHVGDRIEVKDAYVAPLYERPKTHTYSVTAPIGQGAFGQVWRVQEEGQDYALKVQEMSLGLREADAMQRLQGIHGVVSLAASNNEHFVCLNNSSCIVSPYLEGGDMFEAERTAWKEKREIDVKLALRVGYRLADTLAQVHARGFVHADVKGKNVMLVPTAAYSNIAPVDVNKLKSASGQLYSSAPAGDFKPADPFDVTPVLVDFGNAQQPGKKMAGCRGTGGYIAPEILQKRIISAKSDVFALGVMLYRFIGGPRVAQHIGENCKLSSPTYAYDCGDPAVWNLKTRVDQMPELRALLHEMFGKQPDYRPTASEAADRLRALEAAM